MTDGPPEDPGKRSTFFLEVGAVDPFKLLSELPDPLASPLPLENGKEEDILLLTEGCLSGLPRSGYRQVFVWQGPVFRKMFELQIPGICSFIYTSELAATRSI